MAGTRVNRRLQRRCTPGRTGLSGKAVNASTRNVPAILSFDRSDPACPTCTPAPPAPFLVSPSSTRLVRLVTPINSASAASASPDRRTPCVRATRRSQRAAAIVPRNGPAIFHRRTSVHGNRQQRSNRRPCLSPAHRHAQGLKSPNTSLSSC